MPMEGGDNLSGADAEMEKTKWAFTELLQKKTLCVLC
jgi:hypothetical protein